MAGSMVKSPFPSFPECCQKLLVELEREGRAGGRNCEKGHAISLDHALRIEAEARRKSAALAEPVRSG